MLPRRAVKRVSVAPGYSKVRSESLLMAREANSNPQSPRTEQQVLRSTTALVSAGFGNQHRKLESFATITVDGRPAHSSYQVEHAVLRFIADPSRLRKPMYSAATKTITMWLPLDQFAAHRDLVNQNDTLWVGFYGDEATNYCYAVMSAYTR